MLVRTVTFALRSLHNSMICRNTLTKNGTPIEYNGVVVSVYEKLDKTQAATWKQFASSGSVFLDYGYITALQFSAADVDYRYVFFEEKGTLIGIAAFQLVWVEAVDPADSIQKNLPLLRNVARSLMGAEMKRRIVVAGNSFSTGAHGFRFIENVPEIQRIALVSAAANLVVDREKAAGGKVSAVLFKDFFENGQAIEQAYRKANYAPVNQEANMLLPLPAHWQSFDDYQNALTSKYRTKVRSVLRKSEALEIHPLNAQDIERLSDKIYALYAQVRNHADFRMGTVSQDTFLALAENLGEKFTMFGYYLNDELVGFQCGIANGNCLDAHLVGFDYSLNQRYAIYQRILYRYIADAISDGFEVINFGRTALEIKSTVGAFPVKMYCYMRHTGKAPNTVLKLFSGFVSPPKETSHLAYKITELPHFPERITQLAIEKRS